MAAISGIAALGGMVLLARPARSEGAIYGKRIVGTMAIAFALILALFAWGLERAGG